MQEHNSELQEITQINSSRQIALWNILEVCHTTQALFQDKIALLKNNLSSLEEVSSCYIMTQKEEITKELSDFTLSLSALLKHSHEHQKLLTDTINYITHNQTPYLAYLARLKAFNQSQVLFENTLLELWEQFNIVVLDPKFTCLDFSWVYMATILEITSICKDIISSCIRVLPREAKIGLLALATGFMSKYFQAFTNNPDLLEPLEEPIIANIAPDLYSFMA